MDVKLPEALANKRESPKTGEPVIIYLVDIVCSISDLDSQIMGNRIFVSVIDRITFTFATKLNCKKVLF